MKRVAKKLTAILASYLAGEVAFFLLEAAWLNKVRCPGGRPSVS